MNSVDTDKSGKISPDEYQAVMNMHNRDLVIDALVNPRNELYDHSLSVREFAKWRASSDEAIWNEEQKKKQQQLNKIESLNKNKRDGINTNYGYRTFTQLEETYNKLKNNELITYGSGQNLIRFEPKENGMYVNPVDGKEYTKEYLRQLLEIPLSVGNKFEESNLLQEGLDLDKANQNIKKVDRTSNQTKKDVEALGNLLNE